MPFRKVRPAWVSGAVLACAWVLFFAPQFFSDGVPFYRDTLVSIIPWRAFIRERVLSGHLPHWFPYEGLGVPFIGQIATATFHPQTWLLLPLTAVTAVKCNILGAYLFALVGMYRLARALDCSRTAAVTAAFAFAFGGYSLGISHNLAYLSPHATLPFLAASSVHAGKRGRPINVVAVGVFWSLLVLGGDAQAFFTAPLVVGAGLIATRAPWRRSLLVMVSSGALALGLSSIELLPASVVGAESVRALGTASSSLGDVWSLHPIRLLEFLCPGFVPDEVRNDVVRSLFGGAGGQWATSVFMGAVALTLAVCAVRSIQRRAAIAFFSLAALALWLAFGARAGLLTVLWKVLPPLSYFRYPEKYVSLAWLAMAALVALGTDAARKDRRFGLIAAGGVSALCALLAAIAAPGMVSSIAEALGRPLAGGDELASVVAAAWRSGFLRSLLFGLAMTAVLALATRKRQWLLGAIAVLVFGELIVNGQQLPLASREAVLGQVEQLPRSPSGAPLRVLASTDVRVPLAPTLPTQDEWVRAIRSSLRANTSSMDGIDALGSNLPATPWRYALALGGSKGPASLALAARFGACFRTEPAGTEDATSFVITPLPCRPWAELAEAVSAQDSSQALAQLKAGVDGDAVFVEGLSAAKASGSVRMDRYDPDEELLRTELSSPGVLVVREQFASGWTARIDGAETAIHPADVAARAIELPSGAHEVSFSYRTPRFAAGALVSGAAALIALAFALRHLRFRRSPASI